MLLPGWSAMPAVDQVAQALVVVAGPEAPRLFDQATWVTPRLSPAVPLRVSGVVRVVKVLPPAAGLVMATVGGVASGPEGVALKATSCMAQLPLELSRALAL